MNEDKPTRRLGQVAIDVVDLEAARDFYGTQLGLALAMSVEGMLFYACGDVRLMISRRPAEGPAHAGSILYFHSDDLPSDHERLEQAGVPIAQPPHVVHRTDAMELWMAFYQDPEGNVVALMQTRSLET